MIEDAPECVFDEDCGEGNICEASACEAGTREEFDDGDDVCTSDPDCAADCPEDATCACSDGVCITTSDVGCTTAADCADACPLGELGCTCADILGEGVCRERCEEDIHCSAGTCNEAGHCEADPE